jgi:hypothetical protein
MTVSGRHGRRPPPGQLPTILFRHDLRFAAMKADYAIARASKVLAMVGTPWPCRRGQVANDAFGSTACQIQSRLWVNNGSRWPYSSTSSAWPSSVGGTVRPSSLTVLRLITSMFLLDEPA